MQKEVAHDFRDSGHGRFILIFIYFIDPFGYRMPLDVEHVRIDKHINSS
jgi:hypothetical protein